MSANLADVVVNWSNEGGLPSSGLTQSLSYFLLVLPSFITFIPGLLLNPLPGILHRLIVSPMYNRYILSTTLPYQASKYMLIVPFLPFMAYLVDAHDTHATDPYTQINLVATPSHNLDKSWYPDSGATNHFSHGIPTVYVTHPYTRSGKESCKWYTS